MIPKPTKRPKRVPRPMKQQGPAAAARAADRRALEKRSPPNHQGYYRCYIGEEMTKHVDLEHVFDSSTHPELFREPANHKWACNSHNISKKKGTLAPSERARVQKAEQEVISATLI